MPWSYCCSECKARLNPDRIIVLVAHHEEQRMLVGFHPDPGNYEIFVPPGTAVEKGSVWEFSCPVCRANLAAPDHANLCAIDITEGNETRRVLFSRVAGEQVTIVVGRRGVEQQLGADAAGYVGYAKQMKYM